MRQVELQYRIEYLRELIAVALVTALTAGCAGTQGGSSLEAGASAKRLSAATPPSDHKATPTRPAIENSGFEAGVVGAVPVGWATYQHAGPISYRFSTDGSTFLSGQKSARIDTVGPEHYGAMTQRIDAASLRGKRLRLNAHLKTKEVSGPGLGLMLKAESAGATLVYNAMENQLLRGSNDWKHHGITLVVPSAATHVELGAVLQGPGTAWIDDVSVEVSD